VGSGSIAELGGTVIDAVIAATRVKPKRSSRKKKKKENNKDMKIKSAS